MPGHAGRAAGCALANFSPLKIRRTVFSGLIGRKRPLLEGIPEQIFEKCKRRKARIYWVFPGSRIGALLLSTESPISRFTFAPKKTLKRRGGLHSWIGRCYSLVIPQAQNQAKPLKHGCLRRSGVKLAGLKG